MMPTRDQVSRIFGEKYYPGCVLGSLVSQLLVTKGGSPRILVLVWTSFSASYQQVLAHVNPWSGNYWLPKGGVLEFWYWYGPPSLPPTNRY